MKRREFLNLPVRSLSGVLLYTMAGEPVRSVVNAAPGNGAAIGGIKVVADNGWFAARPSGTEEVYKIYAESFRDERHLRRIQQDAQDAIAQLFKG